MCGRFTLTKSTEEVAKTFHVERVLCSFQPSFNVAPNQLCPIVYYDRDAKRLTLEDMKWGLVPSWAKEPHSQYSTINARAETLAEKPTFKRSLPYRRCLVPVDGFYEWQKVDSSKQPYRILMKDQSLFALAGLWDEWTSKETDDILRTFTIITTDANTSMQALHNRMPVIVSKEDWETWLSPSHEELSAALELLHPYGKNDLTYYAVSTKVNSPRNNDPGLIEPV